MGLRSQSAEPGRVRRRWKGRAAGQRAVYANRWRTQGREASGFRHQGGEKLKRNFTHQFDRGGLRA